MKAVADRGIYSKRLRDGSIAWYVRCMSHGRRRHYGSFRTAAEARQFRQRLKAEALLGRAGLPIEQIDLTIGQMIDDYLRTVTHRRDARGQVRFGTWWKTRLGTRRARSLTAADLEEAKVALLHSGRYGARSAGTVNHHLKWFKHVLWVKVRPRAWVLDLWADVKLLEVLPKLPVIATEAEEKKLYRALRPEDLEKVQLGRWLGIRRGQLFGMLWERLTWSTWVYRLEQFKRQKERPLPIPRPARPILRRIWVRQGLPKSGPLFPSPQNPRKPLDANAWYKQHFIPALKRAGLRGRKIVFHTLRHTWATRGLEAGVNPLTLQKMGGWSDRKQVERYAQVLDPTLKEGMELASQPRTNGRNWQLSKRKRPAKKRIRH